MTAPPPCAGKWELFDSTCPADHAEAAELCHTCPLIEACRDRLADARRRSYNAEHGPRGTWAGELVNGGERNPLRLAAEERMFTAAELRTAHADFAQGYRSPRTVMGERIYQRQRKRKKRGVAA